jgi:hypothetical protein
MNTKPLNWSCTKEGVRSLRQKPHSVNFGKKAVPLAKTTQYRQQETRLSQIFKNRMNLKIPT